MMSNERFAKYCRENAEHVFNNMCAEINDDSFITMNNGTNWNELVRTESATYNELKDILNDDLKLREEVFSELDKIIDKIIKLERELKELMTKIKSYPREIKHQVLTDLCVQIQILNEPPSHDE